MRNKCVQCSTKNIFRILLDCADVSMSPRLHYLAWVTLMMVCIGLKQFILVV